MELKKTDDATAKVYVSVADNDRIFVAQANDIDHEYVYKIQQTMMIYLVIVNLWKKIKCFTQNHRHFHWIVAQTIFALLVRRQTNKNKNVFIAIDTDVWALAWMFASTANDECISRFCLSRRLLFKHIM